MTPSELSEKLWERATDVVAHLLPEGKREGGEWVVGGTDGGKGRSLKVNLAGKQKWSDFATGESGDLIDLWGAVRHLSSLEAMKEAKAFLGIQDTAKQFKQASPKKNFSKPKKNGLKKPENCYAYLENRGLTRETVDNFKITDAMVYSHDDNRELPAIAFPYLRDGELLQVKRISTERPNGKKVIMAEANCEPCLFGWNMLLPNVRFVAICEGEIDCMSLVQYGIPALSVPFGGGTGQKQQWIEYEYERLEQFDRIYLCLDSDETGLAGAKEIAARIGEHRCQLVTLPFKDANECLQNGITSDQIIECFENSTFFDPEELFNASEFRDRVKQALYNPRPALFKSPWSTLHENFVFRDAELTLMNGVNNHGKTQMVGHIMLDAMYQGIKTCVASLEVLPERFFIDLLRQTLCAKKPPESEVDAAFNWYSELLWVFNLTGSAKTDRLLANFLYAKRRYGIQLFVIDNLTKCGIDDDDLSGQKAFVEALCDFKNRHRVHIILVTHPRKTLNEDKPVGKMDIKGSGAITDLADNLFTIYRNKPRENALSKKKTRGEGALSEEERTVLRMPPSLLCLDKQRGGEGWCGRLPLWFDALSRQFLATEKATPMNYVYREPQEEIDWRYQHEKVTEG